MKRKITYRALIILLALMVVFSPSFTNFTNASITTLSITTNQNNIVSSRVPAINFTGGVTGVTSSVPVVTFAGGLTSQTSTVPSISFSGGVDNVSSSIPSLNFQGGINETKASRVLTVNSLPDDAESIQIGSCAIIFSLAGDDNDDLDCAGGAVISTTTATATPRTAEQIAEKMRGLINVGDINHGNLVVGGSTTLVSFTTNETETTNTEINFIDSTSDNISSSSSMSSIMAVAASSTITIPAGLAANATDHSITIDGVVIDLGTSAKTADQIAAQIAATNFTAGTNYATGGYTVTNPSGAIVTFTKNTAGAAGNGSITIADANYGATSQVVIVTPSNITPGETAVLVINGVSYSYVIQSGDTAISVVNGLKNAITESNLTKTGTDTLILTSRIAGTAFSISDNSQAAPPAVVVKKKSSKDKKDEKKKSRDIKNKSSIKRGAVLVQSGKRFSKNSPVLLYFSKPGGGYYPPTKIQTSKSGTFSINYRVTKPVGKYSWYAIDSKTGKKSKTVTYTVK